MSKTGGYVLRRIKMVLAILVVMAAALAAFAGPAMARDYNSYDPYAYNSYDPYAYNSYDPYAYNSTDPNSFLNDYVDSAIYNDLYGYGNGYSPYGNGNGLDYGYSPYGY